MPTKLSRDFYARETLLVARDLLGMHLVRGGGRRASRWGASWRPGPIRVRMTWRRIPRGDGPSEPRVIFGPPGHAYVYLIYGFWNLPEPGDGRAGDPTHAVLLRGLEPVKGISSDDAWAGPVMSCPAYRSRPEWRRSAGRHLVAGEANPLSAAEGRPGDPDRRRLRRGLDQEALAVLR